MIAVGGESPPAAATTEQEESEEEELAFGTNYREFSVPPEGADYDPLP